MANKLYGQDLIEYVKANPGLPEKDLAVGAGYFSEVTNEDGETRIQIHTKPFYQELSMATGLVAPKSVGKSGAGGGRRGKGLSYNLKTNPNSGNAVVTSGYLRQIGVEPGDRVSVEVIEEAGEVVLKLFSEEEETQSPSGKTAEPALV